MSASSLSLPIFLRINFLISYLIVTDSQNTFDWHTQRALLNDKKAGAGCTSRAFKHPGRDVTAPDVWPSILTDYTYDSELDNADGVPLASRRSSMFPEGNLLCLMHNPRSVLTRSVVLPSDCLSGKTNALQISQIYTQESQLWRSEFGDILSNIQHLIKYLICSTQRKLSLPLKTLSHHKCTFTHPKPFYALFHLEISF